MSWGIDIFGEFAGIPTGTGYTAIGAGPSAGFAVAADGSLRVWGFNNGDYDTGLPTGTDFTAVTGNYNGGLALRGVPEPSTFVLAAMSFVGMGFATWRRKMRKA